MQENLNRMIKLADEVFDVRNDPDQLAVNTRVIARLKKIHPNTISEKHTPKGPVAWIIVIPTNAKLMELFLKEKINERELLKKTKPGEKYDAIYLCSALVLPEYRQKGLAKKLICRSVKSIKREYPIRALYYWGFSRAGERLARSVARETGLPLFKRNVPNKNS